MPFGTKILKPGVHNYLFDQITCTYNGKWHFQKLRIVWKTMKHFISYSRIGNIVNFYNAFIEYIFYYYFILKYLFNQINDDFILPFYFSLKCSRWKCNKKLIQTWNEKINKILKNLYFFTYKKVYFLRLKIYVALELRSNQFCLKIVLQIFRKTDLRKNPKIFEQFQINILN